MNKFKKFISQRLKILMGLSYGLNIVHIETTGSCTNRCYMCPSRAGKKKRKYMSDYIFEKVIDELSSQKFSKTIFFEGQNEPLLDKRLFERIDFARKKLPNAEFILMSNFTFLPDGSMEKLLNSPIDRLVTDVYALDKEEYKKICGTENAEKVIKNIEKFSKRWAEIKPYEFNLYTFENRYNRESLENIKRFMEGIPCSNRIFYFEFANRNVVPKKRNNWFFDLDLFSAIMIRGNGDVSPCVFDCNSEMKIGNVVKDNIYDLLNNKKARKIRRELFYNGKKWQDYCAVCDAATEHKILYFLLPFRGELRHKIYNRLGMGGELFDKMSKEEVLKDEK